MFIFSFFTEFHIFLSFFLAFLYFRNRSIINKFVFAGALGYQCKFTKKFSAFGELTYSARQKNDKDNFNAAKISAKTGESWGFNLGVTYHI